MEKTSQKLGKYTLVRHIATGGMAEIWLAEQSGPGDFSKQLVIKRILAHLASDRQFTQMFLDEARTVAQLAHPNIGQIYELGEIKGSYFIAMEYIEGLDLSDAIEYASTHGQPIPVGISVYVTMQLLQALEYAHDFVGRDGTHMELVHRDVTPHNVLVSNDGVVKLVDFGVAKARANHSKTQTGAIKGKFAYMAPEQINGQSDLDRRVDVFATGVVLYEMLTGQKPFGDDLLAVNGILNVPTPDPREHRSDIPQSLVNMLRIALAKDRAQRYQSAQTMLADLEDFMRAAGLYCSQRDVAIFIREIQGIELTETLKTDGLAQGPRARITEMDQSSVSTSPSSGRYVAPTTSPHARVETDEIDVPPRPSSGPIPSQPLVQMPATDAFEATPSGGRSGALVMVFSVVILGILAAGAFAGYLMLESGDGGGETQAGAPSGPVISDNDPKNVPPQAVFTDDLKPEPSALLHEDGMPIFVKSNKPARVFFEGTFVGTTRYATSLRAGNYDLTFKTASGQTKRQKIKVERAFQTFDVAF